MIVSFIVKYQYQTLVTILCKYDFPVDKLATSKHESKLKSVYFHGALHNQYRQQKIIFFIFVKFSVPLVEQLKFCGVRVQYC